MVDVVELIHVYIDSMSSAVPAISVLGVDVFDTEDMVEADTKMLKTSSLCIKYMNGFDDIDRLFTARFSGVHHSFALFDNNKRIGHVFHVHVDLGLVSLEFLSQFIELSKYFNLVVK